MSTRGMASGFEKPNFAHSPGIFTSLAQDSGNRLHLATMLPAALKPGDGIALDAPARFVTAEAVEAAVSAIREAGFEPLVSDSLLARDGQFGGSDRERTNRLNAAFADVKVRAIWAMRGGYGCARLLPFLDENRFQSDPKWIIGFSDVTALHAWAQRQGVASLHAAVANTHPMTQNSQVLWEALRNPIDFAMGKTLVPHPDHRVVGGNLSVLYSLLGTPYFPAVDGCWLLLEDLDEYLYHLDRMFNSFKLAGVFERMHGLIMGSFSDLRDNTIAYGQAVDNPFGRGVQTMIQEHVPAGKPVVWDAPVGHGLENVPVVLG